MVFLPELDVDVQLHFGFRVELLCLFWFRVLGFFLFSEALEKHHPEVDAYNIVE